MCLACAQFGWTSDDGGSVSSGAFTTTGSMTPQGAGTIVSDYTALLSSGNWLGSNLVATGNPVVLTYSFQNTAQTYLSPTFTAEYIASFQPLNEAARNQARDAFNQWDAATGIRFIEVESGYGAMQLGAYNFALDPGNSGFSGYAYYPSSTFSPGGDVFINTSVANNSNLVGLFLHEIGHALGLKHPFSGDITLTAGLDNKTQTVMSYTGQSPLVLGPLDIQAGQFLYGTNALDSQISASYDAALQRLIVTGSSAADRLIGGYSSDLVSGGDGNDTINGYEGNDTLVGGAGNDSLDGGMGSDVADYSTETAAVIMSDAAGLYSAYTITSAATGTDTITNIEGIFGGSGNDRLLASYIYSFAVSAVVGSRLVGGFGDDTLRGLTAADTLEGGEGFDIIDFGQNNSAVTLNLASQTVSGGNASGDIISGIEGAIGTFYNDTLVGDAQNNRFEGYWGSDSINGGDGFDIAEYRLSTSAVQINLGTSSGSGGHAFGDVLNSIEGLVGSAYGDTLTGNTAANLLDGLDGNDTLLGGAGDDTLEGGAGVDTASYVGAVGTGVAVTLGTASAQAVGGGLGSDTLRNIENVIGSALADNLSGDALANRLEGGFGNDTLGGGAGSDTLVGGDGNDIIFFAYDDTAANVTGGIGTDTLYGVDVSAPTSFNLVAQGFENATIDQNDTSGQSWSLIRFLYTSVWGLDFRDEYYDNGTRTLRDFDQASAFTWTETRSLYTSGGLVDFQDEYYDNGTRTLRDFDQSSAFSWTETRQLFTSTGLVDFQDEYYDNGTRTLRDLNQAGTGGWTETRSLYTSGGLVDFQDEYYTNGTRILRDFDQASANSWREIRQGFTSASLLDYQDVYYDNNTRIYIDYDQANAFAWNTRTITYNAAGAQVSDVFV